MTHEEIKAWLARTESSCDRWTEDEIFRLNGRGAKYYRGGTDGIYMEIHQDGRLEIGEYIGAIPHIIISIEDDALQRHIVELLNRLIENPGLIEAGAPPKAEPPTEVRRLQNELDRELDAFEFDKDRTKKAIFALASEKYKHIDNRQHKAHIMRAAFEKSELLSSFLPELFKAVITFNYKDGTKTITFEEISGSDLDCPGAPRRSKVLSILYPGEA